MNVMLSAPPPPSGAEIDQLLLDWPTLWTIVLVRLKEATPGNEEHTYIYMHVGM